MAGEGKRRSEWNTLLLRDVIAPIYASLVSRARDVSAAAFENGFDAFCGFFYGFDTCSGFDGFDIFDSFDNFSVALVALVTLMDGFGIFFCSFDSFCSFMPLIALIAVDIVGSFGGSITLVA